MSFIGLTLRYEGGCFFQEALSSFENLFLCLFQLLVTARIPWFTAPSSVFRAYHFVLDLSSYRLLPQPLLCPSYKDHCEYVGPTWIFQTSPAISGSFITSAKSCFPCNVIFTGFGDWGMNQPTTLLFFQFSQPLEG